MLKNNTENINFTLNTTFSCIDLDLYACCTPDQTDCTHLGWLVLCEFTQDELRAFGNMQRSWLSGGRHLPQGG